MFKSTLLIFLLAFLILKCNAQRDRNDEAKDRNAKTELVKSKWVLQRIEDAYQNDSIPLSDISSKKILEFNNDTVKEYFYPFKNTSGIYYINKDSNWIYSKSNSKPIKEYEYKLLNDSLVLKRQGRHGVVKEYYSIIKNN